MTGLRDAAAAPRGNGAADRAGRLVASLYEAAAGVGSWRDACDLFCDTHDLWSMQMLGVHTDTGSIAFSLEGGRIALEAATADSRSGASHPAGARHAGSMREPSTPIAARERASSVPTSRPG